jgi:Rrf2 family nitric oxide-sensitive transcriptional repressor
VALAVAPAALRLGPLIRRLEAGQALVECERADGGACTLAPGCRLRGLLGTAEARFYEALDAQSLADII